MKILLFGGTFDPPHNGHMNNLRAALALVEPDRAIVMPAGTPPHKKASTTPGGLRLAMCRCFLALSPKVELSDWEIRQEGRSYTVHTVEMLAAQNPGAALYLSIGSDMLETFTAWRCWQTLLARCTLVVQSRETDDRARLEATAAPLRTDGGRVLFANAPPLPCSSTALRGMLQAGADTAALQALLPPPVPEIIKEYNLYQ